LLRRQSMAENEKADGENDEKMSRGGGTTTGVAVK
jgi:hypothetical protein